VGQEGEFVDRLDGLRDGAGLRLGGLGERRAGLGWVASSRYWANRASESSFAPADSSQVVFSARRPCCAAHVLRATTATPSGTATTSVTPLTFLAAVASNDTSFAPNDGGNAITAVSRPGSLTSPV
jgi:hypothetical protein